VFGQNIPCPGNGTPPSLANFPGTLVLATKPITTSGYYVVSASTNMIISGGGFALCYATTASFAPATGFMSYSTGAGSTLSNTDMLAVNAGDSIEFWCEGSPISGTAENPVWASLTAILVNQVNGQGFSGGAHTLARGTNKKEE
jgi:hypothetical protein